MGDPNGIGPEILATCLRDATLTREIEIPPVGDPQVLASYIDPETKARDGHAWPGMEVVSAEPGFVLSPGMADPLAGALAMASAPASGSAIPGLRTKPGSALTTSIPGQA